MQESSATVFILDKYNPYAKNTGVKLIFSLYNKEYCIREVELEWGKPILDYLLDDNYINFKLYTTYEEALNFVRKMKRNGA